VPLLIGPAYFATGYLAWVIGTVLVGDVRHKGSWFTTFAVPFIASFAMVGWDLGFDPTAPCLRRFLEPYLSYPIWPRTPILLSVPKEGMVLEPCISLYSCRPREVQNHTRECDYSWRNALQFTHQ
jgi:hypothetical protein